MLPRRAGHRVFSALGGLAGRFLGRDRRRAEDNLAAAFPEVPGLVRQAMVRAMFKNLGRNVYEFLTLEGSTKEELLDLVERVEGIEHMQRAYAQGRGVVVITGHIGCWELIPAHFAARGYPVEVVGRRMRVARLDQRLTEIRESLGVSTIDRDANPRRMLEMLRRGTCLGILIDQHTSVPGVYVPFFGRPAFTPTAAAKLALLTGAPILPMAIYLNQRGRHVVHVLPPVSVPEQSGSREDLVNELTARCSAAIEDLVRIDPKQWVWFHHRWREPEEVDRVYAVQN